MKIGRIILEDSTPSSKPDRYGAEIEALFAKIFEEASVFVRATVPADPKQLHDAFVRLCDEEKCAVVITTGGTGLGLRDIVPDVTLQVIDKELPGFGEIMRYYSYERVPIAAIARGTAGVRGQTVIINLPSRPKAILFCLKLLREAIAEALEQLTGKGPVLFVDPIEVPIKKLFNFWKKKDKPAPAATT